MAQADNLVEIVPQLVSLAKMLNLDDFGNELNQLVHDAYFKKCDTITGRSQPDYSQPCFDSRNMYIHTYSVKTRNLRSETTIPTSRKIGTGKQQCCESRNSPKNSLGIPVSSVLMKNLK